MDEIISEARERVLEVAQQFFMENGYASVRLKQIADALGMKQASLYYHFPGGKKDLFVAAMRHNMALHQAGIEKAVQDAGSDWIAQLQAVAGWLLGQPPLDLMRMVSADLPALDDPQLEEELSQLSFSVLLIPVVRILECAAAEGQIDTEDYVLVGGSFVTMINALHLVKATWSSRPKQEMAAILTNVMVNGLRKR
jgi:AcrR family transcriptional regulator